MLPTKLIEAFKSTLSELKYADLLLHVIDLSDPSWENHINIVQEIIADLEVEKPVLYVFNKADIVDMTPELEKSIEEYQPNVLVSALDENGLEELTDFLTTWTKEQ